MVRSAKTGGDTRLRSTRSIGASKDYIMSAYSICLADTLRCVSRHAERECIAIGHLAAEKARTIPSAFL